MGHELDFSRKTGRANMFTVKTIPWHNDETNPHILTQAPTFEEALKIAELDYEIQTLPLRVVVNEKLAVDAPMGKAIVRVDRIPSQKAILGMVGDGYTPLQNREAFEILEPLIDRGLIELQTGGVLREGADAWLLGRLIIKDKLVDKVFGNKTVPMILISNNHTGKQPVMVMYTPIEVVCANTLAMAHAARNKFNSMVLKKHTKSVRMNYIEASLTFFNQTLENYKLIAEDYAALKKRILTVEEFTSHVLDVVAPIPEIKEDEVTSHTDSVLERLNNRRNTITQAWENATGNTGNHSAWEAFMAVTELLDYSDSIIKIRKSSSRLQSMINGPINGIKQDVVDSLVELARN